MANRLLLATLHTLSAALLFTAAAASSAIAQDVPASAQRQRPAPHQPSTSCR